ncbi:hypothetical protein DPSP01_002729 [Paraphaeosphaeria sporulosa]|uniref:WHIM1 domain-containing protein n=1 Tax=Paraphaeosphaeria sporulosa TaxID=1460663 RepID=A0A177CQK8_9PLEO|nr:uncharacterized protein CC84DRAFT_1110349 [Paraphaeosphaeria sporulosa]OAG09180.1 hypothetical protein CC84DRAFT_1110349 [Paraphaeosphaeria sporulosa]
MSDSDLSTPPATDDEMPVPDLPAKATKASPQKKKKSKNTTILSFFDKKQRSPTPPLRKKRAPSPPHEAVPEDNPDIAFIVMFRSRFSDAFPPRCPHLGPQDLERGVAADLPTPEVEALLCALLGLVNNRKKPVEKGHYGRALEEAVQTQKSQWPRKWNHINPLHGGRNFNNMSPTDRLDLLKALVSWSLNQSELIVNMIKDGYKSRTSKDPRDTNIPLSVQPWGKDGDKRRYWLIEGQDDTPFRVYRESNPALKHVSWWSVAGSIEEIRALAQKLQEEDGTREAKALGERMLAAIPRFEATEEKRKKRMYRLERKAKLERPVLGYSLYEGRTRGKRMRYTFDENEDEDSDAGVRRSTRNSGRETSAGPSAPTITASGRQVRSRATGMYGETLLSGQTIEGASPATGDYVRSDGSEEPDRPGHGRSTRAAGRGGGAANTKKRNFESYHDEDISEEEDATSWNGDDEDEDEPEQMDLDESDESDEEPSETEDEPHSLLVRLKIGKVASSSFEKGSIPNKEGNVNNEDASQYVPVNTGPPLSGMDAARTQTLAAPVPAPAATAAPIPQPLPPPTSLVAQIPADHNPFSAPEPPALPSMAQLNGLPPQPVQPGAFPPAAALAPMTAPMAAPMVAPPIAAATQLAPPNGETHTLPPLGSILNAPTYAAEEAPMLQAQPSFPPTNPDAQRSPKAFAHTLPAPTPAANWQ